MLLRLPSCNFMCMLPPFVTPFNILFHDHKSQKSMACSQSQFLECRLANIRCSAGCFVLLTDGAEQYWAVMHGLSMTFEHIFHDLFNSLLVITFAQLYAPLLVELIWFAIGTISHCITLTSTELSFPFISLEDTMSSSDIYQIHYKGTLILKEYLQSITDDRKCRRSFERLSGWSQKLLRQNWLRQCINWKWMW